MDRPSAPEPGTEPGPTPSRLDLDVELVPDRGTQDSDAAWGDPAGPGAGDPSGVRRLIEDKPPHHVG